MIRFAIVLALTTLSANAQPFSLRDKAFITHSWDSDARSYFNRVAANGGVMGVQDKDAINRFVQSAKANGYWSYLLDCGPLAGNNTNAALVKLKDGTGTSPLLTLTGFSAADYTRTNSFYGKTNCWLDTNLPQSLLVTNHHGMAVWFMDSMTNKLSTAEVAMGLGTGAGAPILSMYTDTTPENFNTLSYDSIPLLAGGTIRFGQGLHSVSRTAINLAERFVNGRVVGRRSTEPTWTPVTKTNTLTIYAGEQGTSAVQSFLNKSIGWYGIDSGIPLDLQDDYYSDVKTLMRRLGRIPQPPWPQLAFLVNGQSLAIGSGAGSALLTTVAGTMTIGAGTVIPVAGVSDHFKFNRSKQAERTVETGWRAFGDHFTALCDAAGYGRTNDPFIANWATGGAAYDYLRKGSGSKQNRGGINTNNYQHSIDYFAAQAAFQTELIGNTFKVGAILSVHGESDTASTAYGTNMLTWQSDYQADIQSATSQTNPVPIFHTQPDTSGFPATTNKPWSSLNMLSLHETNGGAAATQILVGPKYQLLSSDGTHLTNISYQMMGEYYAESVFKRVVQGQAWEPLRPTAVATSGSNVTVTFNKDSLVFDTVNCSDPGNYGFTYTDDGPSVPSISTVAIAGATSNQVTVTLSGAPNANAYIRYALNAAGSTNAGPFTGARGNLRDQAAAIGTRSTSNLWNWCVHFEKPTIWP